MNSPRGSARAPVRLVRDDSISPLPLDPAIDSWPPPSPKLDISAPKDLHRVRGQATGALFALLPSKVILRILWLVDANTFASLCIINRQWRQEAQRVELYAHHLSRCPSYALSNSIISGPFRKNDLSRLKAKFTAEVRRNLFDAYLRPRKTFISLVSLHANSSAAFPAGEAFRFEFSPNAQTILALSSSRIYVLDATADQPVVKRQLKTLRRPLSASVTDDGSLLAVLSTKHQVNIYGLTPYGVQHLQVIVLDNPPKIIAIAHEGTVLAASYEAGIEVFSLAANSLTTDRRAVRSEAVDTLSFSGDGSMLVGSSLSLDDPNAVVISAPFYTENDPDLSPREIHSRMWTTQILFPQISSVCSHVALIPAHTEGDACWLFAFDHSLMSYRAVRTDDTRAGVAYFLSPPGIDRFDTPIPTFPPSASACGTLAVAGFEEGGLWLYGIPERLDLSPDMGAVVERQNERYLQNGLRLTSATGVAEPLMAYSPSNSAGDSFIEDDSLANKVDWRQSLFVRCRNVHGLAGQTAARWVEPNDSSSMQTGKRLVVVAPGGVSLDGDELGDEVMPVDGSRMCLLDFDYLPSVSSDRVLTIEVGEEETELLTEHTGSLANEVAMERRRTIRAIPPVESSRMPLGRSVTSILPPTVPSLFEQGVRRGSVSSPSSPTEPARGTQVFPNSALHRSATASGFRHARYPPRPPLGSVQSMNQNHAGYHRTDHYGRPISEDSWETPPPPYTGANSPSHSHHPIYGGTASIRGHLQNQASQSNDRSAIQPLHTQFRPYRALVAERAGGNLDAIMTSRALPSGATISQYEELMMAARSRGPSESSLDTATERSRNMPSSPDLASSNIMSFSSRPHIDGSSRMRPMTHQGTVSHGWQGPSRSMTMPFPSAGLGHPQEVVEEHIIAGPVKSSAAHRMSLTGANLQNRLNHPVPPIPEISQSSVRPERFSAAEFGPENRRPAQHSREGGSHPLMPTADQMSNLYQRVSQSEMQRPVAVQNTNFVHRAPGNIVLPSPPRGAWGAAGVPGSPTFNQARNVPNGFALLSSNSRNTEVSHLASASAPNLLAQRPRYGRLDTIDSVTDTIGIAGNSVVVRSRAHSMTQANLVATVEPSAYHETSRSGPGTGSTKHGKKTKKKKEETTKKSSRCTVM